MCVGLPLSHADYVATSFYSSAKMVNYSTAVAAFTGLVISVSALGINCRGSGNCQKYGDSVMSNFVSLVDNLDPYADQYFQNGEHILCIRTGGQGDDEGYCLFLQGTGYGIPGSSVKPLVEALSNHGCQACGSVPIFFPQGNNSPDLGILVANQVSATNCKHGYPLGDTWRNASSGLCT